MKPAGDPPAPSAPRYSKGAIGAVSRSIEDLRRRSVVEIDARLVDGAGLKDRLDPDDPDLSALIASIETYGQQVPVLLRPNPNYPERYEVVYGRRRVAALKALGQPVKALIRVLNDRDLVLAQGQENTARKDLSFIEKANFARQMRDAGYDRKTMCDALSMDKTLISRMLSVADRIPLELIEAIGSAHAIGRDRWLALADRIGKRDLVNFAKGDTSEARFEAVMSALKTPTKPKPKPQQIKTAAGKALASVAKAKGKTVLNVDTSEGFDEWLVENLQTIHRDWQQKRGG
jgi:ParB family chromosome partitioning protein